MIKKILFGILILVVVLIISLVLVLKSLNNQKESNEEILKSENTSSHKALIIFQPSMSDVTSKVANSMAEGLNDGGYEVTINYPGDYLATDISKYSLVIFGSPIYVGQPLSIVTDYMAKVKDYSSSKVILFVTASEATIKTEFNTMEESLNATKAYKKVKFTGDKEESKKKAYDLGKELAKE